MGRCRCDDGNDDAEGQGRDRCRQIERHDQRADIVGENIDLPQRPRRRQVQRRAGRKPCQNQQGKKNRQSAHVEPLARTGCCSEHS